MAAAALLTLASLPVASLPAQVRGRLTVHNLAPHSRAGWARVVVPFAEGEVFGEPRLYLTDRPIVWRSIGARWRDGSTRQALCMFPVMLTPFSEKHYQLTTTPGPYSKFDLRPILGQPAPAEILNLTVRHGGATETATPAYVRTLESNPARRVDLFRARVGQSGLVYELIVTAYTGDRHVEVDIAIFFSDPNTVDMMRRLESVTIQTKQSNLVIRHGPSLGVRHEQFGRGSLVTLLKETPLADGQGIRRTGVLIPTPRPGSVSNDPSQWLVEQTLKAAAICQLVGATTWRWTRAFGPFGDVPNPGSWLPNQNAELNANLKRHQSFLAGAARGGDPFRNFGLTLDKFAGRTGDQPDFGIIKMTPIISTGVPTFLLEAELAVLQESCRPVHHFEADGRIVRSNNHPQWMAWDGRTHWNLVQSPDRLGKAHPEPPFESHDWSGKDHQHWSSNHLCGYYLLTGDHWALREIEHEVQLYLASHGTTPGVASGDIGAARSVGRTLMAGCWLYQCTGNDDLVVRLRDRVVKIYEPGWPGRNFEPDRVRPMEIRPPDGRHLEGRKAFWAPWQDSLAAIGLAAIARLTGEPKARYMADEIALTCLRHGWRFTREGPRLAYALAWHEDARPIDIKVDDIENVEWGDPGLSSWGIGAVEIARQASLRRGDDATAAMAAKIQAAMRSSRVTPRDGWFDEFGDWDAVR